MIRDTIEGIAFIAIMLVLAYVMLAGPNHW